MVEVGSGSKSEYSRRKQMFSALPPVADSSRTWRNVRLVPVGELVRRVTCLADRQRHRQKSCWMDPRTEVARWLLRPWSIRSALDPQARWRMYRPFQFQGLRYR